MTGKHARRRAVPFWSIAVALAGTAAAIALGAAGGERAAPSATASATPRATGSPTAEVTPEPSPEPEEPKGSLVIHATGDVSLDPTYIPAFRANGYGWAWSGLDGLFRRDDLTIVNHECPSTDVVAPEAKEFVFRCDPAALDDARRAGVDVVNLANNHAFDQGPEGLLDSLRNVRRARLVAVGAGRDRASAERPAVFDLSGWRVAVIGVGEVIDPEHQVAGPDEPGTAVGHDFPRALAAIRAADREADLVLVVIHWGVELDTQPRAYQVDEAHRMIDAGADAIFGHHTHRLGPLETYRGRPIFYSLGNFVWPRLSTAGATTAVAEVAVTPGGRVRGRLLPVEIVSDGHPVLR
jgi:poly-gamma-glutamate synthesis protein (capsule biosynthesis protein)